MHYLLDLVKDLRSTLTFVLVEMNGPSERSERCIHSAIYSITGLVMRQASDARGGVQCVFPGPSMAKSVFVILALNAFLFTSSPLGCCGDLRPKPSAYPL